jgi:hypothetical protein
MAEDHSEKHKPERKPHFWLSDIYPDNYSNDIYFDSYGWSWGLDDDLDSCCLGETERVLAIIKGEEKMPEDIGSTAKAILLQILKDREEENGRDKITTRTPGIQRGRSVRSLRNRQKKTRLLETRKRVSLRLPYSQVKSLLDR